VERIFRTVREEVLDEVGDRIFELAELNSLQWSWVSAEYHRRVHGGTGLKPLEHWLSHATGLRPAPRAEALDEVFLHRQWRRVRKDGTIRFAGKLLELRSELCGDRVELRFDPERPGRLPRVFVDGEFFCDTVELDVIRNSSRLRRRVKDDVDGEKERPSTGLDPLRQIQAEHERRVAPPGKRLSEREEG
jgi:hypothetical protein